jgi:hypothetical protein
LFEALHFLSSLPSFFYFLFSPGSYMQLVPVYEQEVDVSMMTLTSAYARTAKDVPVYTILVHLSFLAIPSDKQPLFYFLFLFLLLPLPAPPTSQRATTSAQDKVSARIALRLKPHGAIAQSATDKLRLAGAESGRELPDRAAHRQLTTSFYGGGVCRSFSSPPLVVVVVLASSPDHLSLPLYASRTLQILALADLIVWSKRRAKKRERAGSVI